MNLTEKKEKIYLYCKFLIDLLPSYILKIEIINNEISIFTKIENFLNLIIFLKKHMNSKLVQLIDICGVDYFFEKMRFQIIYNLLSLKYNFRLKIKLFTNELIPIPSLCLIYSSAN